MATYEEGVAALKCHEILDKAGRKVQLLLKGESGDRAKDFDVKSRSTGSGRAEEGPAGGEIDSDDGISGVEDPGAFGGSIASSTKPSPAPQRSPRGCTRRCATRCSRGASGCGRRSR